MKSTHAYFKNLTLKGEAAGLVKAWHGDKTWSLFAPVQGKQVTYCKILLTFCTQNN